MEPIRLTWLPNWHAYAVRRGDRVLGLIMCRAPTAVHRPGGVRLSVDLTSCGGFPWVST